MTEKEFLNKLMDAIDAETELTMNSVLVDIAEWDSLSVVSFIAMANMEAGKKLQASQVQDASTVSDLYKLVK